MAMPVLLLLRRAPIPTTKRRTSFVITVVVLVVLGVLSAGLFARPAHASTFTVTNTDDSGAGSLRKAIEDANNNGAGADTIKFNIPESDPNCSATTNVCTISSGSPMPQITGKVTIDGYSQGKGTKDTTEDDAKPNTLAVGNDAVLKIELNGTGSAPGATGLWISAAKSTVKGLVINGWEQGIRISGSGATGNKVEGNFIGTDASGTKDPGANNPANTSLFGVTISEAPGNTVGGTRPAQRNNNLRQRPARRRHRLCRCHR